MASTNTGTTTSANDDTRYAHVRELKTSVAPNMPTWKPPVNAAYNTPDKASYELACLLEAIEMYGLEDVTFGDYSDDADWVETEQQDARNFNTVVEMALAVEGRLKYLAEWVPPQGMEYIRHVAGRKLVETFEGLARKYDHDVFHNVNAQTQQIEGAN